jgi:hypothetical protein
MSAQKLGTRSEGLADNNFERWPITRADRAWGAPIIPANNVRAGLPIDN